MVVMMFSMILLSGRVYHQHQHPHPSCHGNSKDLHRFFHDPGTQVKSLLLRFLEQLEVSSDRLGLSTSIKHSPDHIFDDSGKTFALAACTFARLCNY